MKALLLVLAVVSIGATFTACRGRSQNSPATTKAPGAPSANAPSAKVWISQDGAIELNGKQVQLEAVDAEFAALAQRKGVVLYGRDAPEAEPHANGMKVIELVAKNRLPIRMSTKRDFSDAIGPDGTLKE